MGFCAIASALASMYVVISLCWLVLLVVWVDNTFRRNRASANRLHCLLTVLPLAQLVDSILRQLRFAAICPGRGEWTMPNANFLAFFFTVLIDPLNLVCLLIVAKGWCITQDRLRTGDVLSIMVFVGLSFATNVLYFILILATPRSAWGITSFVRLGVHAYAAVVAVVSTRANLRRLASQLDSAALASLDVEPARTSIYAKRVMFKRLAIAMVLYAAVNVLLVVPSVWGRVENYTFVWAGVLLRELADVVCVLSIGFVFRARPANVLFRQQTDFVAQQLADTGPPSAADPGHEPSLGALVFGEHAKEQPSVQLSEVDTEMPATTKPPLSNAATAIRAVFTPDGAANAALVGDRAADTAVSPAQEDLLRTYRCRSG